MIHPGTMALVTPPTRSRPVPIDPTRPASGPDAGHRPGPLIAAGWLLEHLDDPDLVLVQVSPTRRVYNRRHLPRAAYGDLHRELALRGRHPATGDSDREWLLPAREHVEAVLTRWGVGELAPDAVVGTRDGPAAATPAGSEASSASRAAPAASDRPGASTPADRAPRIVLYDDVGQNRQAIRGYWLLRLYRYPAGRVHVLDGGLTAWVAEGGPVTDADPRPRRRGPGGADVAQPVATVGSGRDADPRPAARGRGAGDPGAAPAATPSHPIRLGALDPSLITTADQVLAWSAEASAPGGPTRLLDVRTADEFVGRDDRGARRGGRIPGARNRLFSDFLRPDNTLRPVPEALALVRGSGVDPAEVRAVYCQGGVRAALAWFVLHELAGLEGVSSYAGSWEEWGNREDVPVESDVPAVSDASSGSSVPA